MRDLISEHRKREGMLSSEKSRFVASAESLLSVHKVGMIGELARTGKRLIPSVVVDGSSNTAFEEALRMQKHVDSGDCETRWGYSSQFDEVYLNCHFLIPVDVEVNLVFELTEFAMAVDTISRARCMNLYSAPAGAHWIGGVDSGLGVLFDIGADPLDSRWGDILQGTFVRLFKEQGYGRGDAKRKARAHIEEMRDRYGFFIHPAIE